MPHTALWQIPTHFKSLINHAFNALFISSIDQNLHTIGFNSINMLT